MNKENLNKINDISSEIAKIDRFIESYCRAPRTVGLNIYKQEKFLGMTLKPYGFLGNIEFAIPSKLNRKLIDLIVEHRESLVSEQEKLWGQE
ncbi:hypothetical protein D6117_000530 [Lactococcus lactis]|uniref:hypothetical protein n=1 Tax=Lactococcus lactis TaxID=1358 RepID=UPI000F53135F|nr:hypothetical protein [Lactococcus lactis]RQD98940.1 hypothetical protein D6109_10520 [Lactococcus lactis]RQE01216.1 hypothetical protein D6107_10895 [Lactococcus lactis]RQE06777.1 hypothetical protein D6110_07010 [Lactococcus lactis]RQE08754.1 hypothetical protein D6108_10650 [Lactococcus lactis]RQE12546.1 hypothetical protein D6113_08605 [Lactococcus lactis]